MSQQHADVLARQAHEQSSTLACRTSPSILLIKPAAQTFPKFFTLSV
jgi:hypothetical protein